MRGITTSSVFESHLYVFQTALHRRYPLGAASMSRPAVFYLCEQSKHLLPHLERLCWTLMSRRSSFRMLPLREQHETDAAADEQQLQSSSCIDLEELSVFIEQDRDNGALPLLVVASVDTTSSPLLRLDDISALRELADQHGLWLHGMISFQHISQFHHVTFVLPSSFKCACSFVQWKAMPWIFGSAAHPQIQHRQLLGLS